MEHAEDRPQSPKPPRLSHLIAVILELCIVATLVAHRSVMGLLLCAGYAWFSATWALFRREQ
jgi:hypothetical protein